MTIPQQQAQLIAKLRHQGKQYAAGQVARGGAPHKHYLEEAADELEMMALALSVDKVTPQSARENAALRNVIQVACIDGLPGLARAWEKYFPDHPISVKGIEQSTAQPQAVVPARPQEFESAQGRALAVAWAEGWAQCRDAEYVGEDAQDEAFNQSVTLAQCLHADQTRFQGGLSNDQLRRAWSAKMPNVIPTDEQLTAFALGIEAAAQPSAQAERAPVVQAVPASEKDKAIYKEIADNYRGGVQAVQAGEYPPLPEPKLARVRCDECEGSGFLRVSPDPERSDETCSACRGRGWSSETLVHVEDDIRSFADATCAMRASSGATPADVRMLTGEEIAECCNGLMRDNSAIETWIRRAVKKAFAVNAGKRIPASGVIGGV